MKKLKSMVMSCAVVLASAAFSWAATLSGVVKDPDGKPLANVRVQVPAQQKGGLTDASGSYKLTDLLPGFVAVTFKPIGYPETTKNANIADGDNMLDATIAG